MDLRILDLRMDLRSLGLSYERDKERMGLRETGFENGFEIGFENFGFEIIPPSTQT